MAHRSAVASRALVLAASVILLVGGGLVPSVRAADPTPPPSPTASSAPTAPPSLPPTAEPSPATSIAPTPALPSAAPTLAPSPSPTAAPPDPRDGPKPGATEIVAERTEYSQAFDNHDGTKTTQFFLDSAFYRPAGSTTYVPVEVGFTPSVTDGVRAVSDKAPVAVAIADSKAAGDFLSLSAGGRTIGFRLPADLARTATNVRPTIDGPVADYPGIVPGVDLRVIANAHGAKSFFIWHAVPADPTLRYVVDAPGLTLVPRADGSIALVDATDTPIAAIPRPYAVDSTPDAFAGGGRYTGAVSLVLGADGRTVTVRVDPAWLASAVYPVYVDPSTGWVANAGSNSYGDAHTASAFPTTNFDDYQRPDSPYYHELWNGTDPGGISGTSYDYLRWNLGAYANVTVDAASLRLDPYHQYYNAPTTETTYVRRVLDSWTENGITWNTRPDYTASSVSAGCVEASWCVWNVQSIVQTWLKGLTPAANYGFQIDTIGKGSTYWKRFIASEQGSSVPALSITYHTPSATVVAPTGSTSSKVLSWSYADAGSAPQTLYHVDVATDAGFTSIISTSGDASGAATSWTTAANLSDGTTYYWHVRAYNGSSWSAWATSPFMWDATAPSVSAFTAPTTPTAATSLPYSLTFSESVSGLAAGDFTTSGSATGWSVGSITGSGPYTVTLTGGTAGTVILTLNASTVSDGASTGPASPATAATVTVDRTAPSVSAFTAPATPTNATSLPYSLTFSESVSGLAAGDFTISGSATGWSVGSITGSGPYTITLTGGTAGTVILTLGASSVADPAGNAGPASPTTAATVTVDRTAPSVAVFTPPASPTNATSLAYSLTFDEPVTGLTAGDFAIGGTATDWSVTDVGGSGSGPYTVTLTGGTVGTVILTLTASTVSDPAGNAGPTSPSTAATVTVDRTAPGMSEFSAPTTPTAATSLPYSLTFSEPVSDLAAAGFTISGTATGWSVTGLIGAGAGPYTVTLTGGTAGTVILTLDADAVSDGANSGPVSPATAPSVTVDRTAPVPPSRPDLDAASDTGTSSSDDITKATTELVFTGSAEPDATISLFDGLTLAGTGLADGSGAWSITAASPFSDGVHNVSATATDAAGNTGAASAALPVLIVTSVGPADFDAPDEAAALEITSSPFELTWTTPSAPAGIASQTIQTRDAAPLADACAGVTWSAWSAATEATSPHDADLIAGQCHQWQISLVDGAGNTSVASSGTVLYRPAVQLGMAGVTPELVPQLVVELAPQMAALHPGSPITVSAQLSYPAAALGLTADITASNPTGAASTIEAATITLERRAAGQGSWVAFSAYHAARASWSVIVAPPTGLPRLGVSAPGITASGVDYPLSFDAFVGTVLAEGATADWDTHLSVPLDAALIDVLRDPVQTSGIRAVLHLEVSYAAGTFDQPADLASGLTTAVQNVATAVTDATIAIDVEGIASETFDAVSVPALAQLELGATPISVDTDGTVAGPTVKGGAETDLEYIARLRSYGPFTAAAHVTATDATAGPVVADDAQVLVIEMPILVVSVPPLTTATTGGSAASVSLSILNVGNVAAATASAEASLDGTVSGAATGLTPTLGQAETASLVVTYDVPSAYVEGMATSTVAVSWTDAADNPYGPITAVSDIWVTSGQTGYPSVDLTTSDQPMFATEPLIADASDDVAVTTVDLLVDGVSSGTISSAPYDFQWDTSSVSDGDHLLQVRAHDGDGHVATTAPGSVHVDNSLPSEARAQADEASGRLTADEAATIRVDAIIDPTALPSRYQSDATSAMDGTEALLSAVAEWNDLTPATQDAIIDELVALEEEWALTGTPAAVLEIVDSEIAAHCSLLGPCIFETEHFRIEYEIDQSNSQNPPLDDEWELTDGPTLSAYCGACDGVPDWVDRLAYGLEQARQTYNEMGYSNWTGGKFKVAVADYLFKVGPFNLPPKYETGLAIPGRIVVPYRSYSIDNPIYVARHEYFHEMEATAVLGDDISDTDRIANAIILFEKLAADPTHTVDPRWLSEATAEWGAHKAADREPQDWEDYDWPPPAPLVPDHERYAYSLFEMLKAPGSPLSFSDTHHEYGAFIFAEFLEEWAGDSASFTTGSGHIDPVPGVIKDIWTRIGDGQSSLAAINSALAALSPSSSFADALPAFTRANYLLNAPGVDGTYRDPDTARWRELLGASTDPVTHGDDPTKQPYFSDLARPGRKLIKIDDQFVTWQQSSPLQPGGSAYLEFQAPMNSGRYWFEFTTPVGSPVTASIAAFSTYPTPCAAPTTLELTGVDTTVVYLPDECQRVTIMLTHVDPIGGSNVSVQVVIAPTPGLVADTFERSVFYGWGVASGGSQWKSSQPDDTFGDVASGQGRLALGKLIGSRLDFPSLVTDFLAVGQFSDCVATDDLVLVDAGSPIVLTKSGVLIGSPTSSVQLVDFDACRPWFLRLQEADGVLQAKVWQATDPEPATAQVVSGPTGGAAHLEIDTIGFPSTPTRLLILDWIDFENQPYG